MGNLILKYVAGLSIFIFSSAALAAPKVDIKIVAEKEVAVVKNGKQTKKMIAAKKFAPGETIQYTLTYTNSGTEKATNVVISDPIPKGTSYISGSATETGNLTFSVDGGKTFNKAALLTYDANLTGGKKEKRTAGSDQYTDIRWVIDTVEPGTSGKVSFRVKVQ